MHMNFGVRSLLLNLFSSGRRKAAQTIAFYGNSEQVEVLPLSGPHCSALAPSSGHAMMCRTNRKQEV